MDIVSHPAPLCQPKSRLATTFLQRAAGALRTAFRTPFLPPPTSDHLAVSDHDLIVRYLICCGLDEALGTQLYHFVMVIECDVLRPDGTQKPASRNYLRAALGARLGLEGWAPIRLVEKLKTLWRDLGFGSYIKGFGSRDGKCCPNVYRSNFDAMKRLNGAALGSDEWRSLEGSGVRSDIGFLLFSLSVLPDYSQRKNTIPIDEQPSGRFWNQLLETVPLLPGHLWNQLHRALQEAGEHWHERVSPMALDLILPAWLQAGRTVLGGAT